MFKVPWKIKELKDPVLVLEKITRTNASNKIIIVYLREIFYP